MAFGLLDLICYDFDLPVGYCLLFVLMHAVWCCLGLLVVVFVTVVYVRLTWCLWCLFAGLVTVFDAWSWCLTGWFG